MRHLCVLLLSFLLLIPFTAAYGVTFYNPAWNPQDGKVYDVVEAGKPYTLEVKVPDIAITKIIFTINITAKNAGLTVYQLRSLPDLLPEVAENESYEVNELKYAGFVPHNTKQFTYEFKVSKGWLENMTISRSTMALHTYNRVLEVWETLDTEIMGDDDSFVYYKAKGPGVHYLFIGKSQSGAEADSLIPISEEEQVKDELKEDAADVEEVGEPTLPAETLPTDVTPIQVEAPAQPAQPQPPTQPDPSAPAEERDESPEERSRLVGILVLIIIAILIVIGIVMFGKRRVGTSVDKELKNYIKESLKRGKSKSEIRHRLLEVGWHTERVDKALMKHKDSSKPESSAVQHKSSAPSKPAPKKKPTATKTRSKAKKK